MNRRDLLKGALSLPALNSLNCWASICGSAPCTSPAAQPYQVILVGPFGLILHKDNASPPNVLGLTAFMPVDPHKRHKFALQMQPQDETKKFNFLLRQTKPAVAPVPCLDTSFSDFCVETSTWSQNAKAKLLTIDLAVPTRIIPVPGEIPLDVVFKSSTTGKMYTAIILEYDLKVSPLELIHKDSGLNIPLPDKFLYFAVGLPLDDPDTPDIAHGREFHNVTLLSFFPKLKGDPNHFITSAVDQSFHPTGTTFECKAGGIIVGNP